jgi:mannose-1-phosphate guanylyltransferase
MRLTHIKRTTPPLLLDGPHVIGNVLAVCKEIHKSDVIKDASARIGRDCLIGPNVVIGPDCVVENGSTIPPLF